MDRAEVTWRAGAAARTAIERARSHISRPAWNRFDLLSALAPLPELATARAALAAGRWEEAHNALADRFATAPQRFVIHPAIKDSLGDRIRSAFPDSARHAAARADRIVSGDYDLLGYRGLKFGDAWNYDPVHDRRAP